MTLRQLYPPIEPYRAGYVHVDAGRSIYYGEAGNPDGRPALFLHAGPDLVCPLTIAWDLANRWPEAQPRIVDAAGHSAYDPPITHELITATDHFLEAEAR